MVLLGLVKAFERIPHHVVVREAIRHGYPIWLVRLSLATYRLQRVVRVGNAVSCTMVATRGITAGSGFATTELRVIMITIVDAACIAHPCCSPTVYVDDVAIEAVGTAAMLAVHWFAAMRTLVACVAALRLEFCGTKNTVIAAPSRLAHAAVVAVEGGAVGGVGSHVMQMLAEEGMCDHGLRSRSMVLPDIFIDQDSPAKMYEIAGMQAPQIVAKALEALGEEGARPART